LANERDAKAQAKQDYVTAKADGDRDDDIAIRINLSPFGRNALFNAGFLRSDDITNSITKNLARRF
jgi:hypothetical protein